jgi:hypothetical protein
MKTILILKEIRKPTWIYLIDALALRWKKLGYKVLTHYGTKNLPDADIVILHVDATVVPDKYAECLSKYPVVLNRNVMDISKTMISRNILRQDDNYSGPIIVKTNANFGGVPEATFNRISSNKWQWPGWLSTMMRNWEKVDVLNPDKYPIFENKESVPGGVWKNKNLIVERFLPERANGLFFVRYWIFFGEQGWAGRFGAKKPIVKFGSMATKDESVPVPDELRTLRKSLGFDYGRFDYVVHNGETVLHDVNKTLGGAHHLEDYSTQLDIMASGISGF